MAEHKRSRLVSVTAWCFILIGGYGAVQAVYEGITVAAMFASPGFMLSLAGATAPVDMPPLARLAVDNIRLLFVLYFFVWSAVLASGAGLWFRKAWGLVSARWLLYCAAFCCLAILVFPGMLVPKPYMYDGISVTPAFNEAVSAMRFNFQLGSAVLGAALVWFARRFERPEIRTEFGLDR